MLCWMNGAYVKAEDLRISPFDHGFLYGAGFFETFRTYEGDVFLFQAHIDRLKRALLEYRISLPYLEDEILAAVHILNEAAGGGDGYFRLNVSAGVHDIGLAPTTYPTPNVILFRKELPQLVPGAEKRGVWLETVRNNPESAVRQKSHNYLNNIRGRLELSSLKETEGLFVTRDGFVAEGVTSNVFWVKAGALCTPAIDTGILPGTTRQLVIELAKSMNLQVNVGFYEKEDVEQADEVFVTNAIQELVPLASLEEFSFQGANGYYYKKLHDLYKKRIEELKGGQKEWD